LCSDIISFFLTQTCAVFLRIQVNKRRPVEWSNRFNHHDALTGNIPVYVNILEPVRGLCFSVFGEVVLLVTLSRYLNKDFSFIVLAFLVASQLDHLRDM